MFGFGLLGNTKIPHHKNTANTPPVRMPIPAEVLLPLSQHIGANAELLVRVGDEVKVGQRIAEAKGAVSSPVHASVSGKVTKIEDFLRADGRTVTAIRIASDGNMTPAEDLCAPEVSGIDDFIAEVQASGVVGLGGAGFPAGAKLAALKSGEIDTVVLNGAECEPYITCDTVTMLERSDDLYYGINLIKKFAPSVKKFIFGVEVNKPECIEELARIFADDESVSIVPLPTKYPQGSEKVIIYNTTRRVVPEGKYPADIGILVINVTSLACLAEYFRTGTPLVERVITVDGSAVSEPKNVIAPLGASVGDILAFVGVNTDEAGKILLGGPMMGTPIWSLSEPVTKTTGAIVVMNRKEAKEWEATACIHCGRCVTACPMGLNPTAFSKALSVESKEDRIARLEEHKVLLCMECGCCSYVCPANRPLVQNNRLGKAEVRDHQAHQATLKN